MEPCFTSHPISLTSLLNFVFFPELMEGIVLRRNLDTWEIKTTLPHETSNRSVIERHSDFSYNARYAE